MANIRRSCKPGHEWNRNDLESYNIHLRAEGYATFFAQKFLPSLQDTIIDPEFHTKEESDDMHDDKNVDLMNLMELAMTPSGSSIDESAVIDFTVQLFKSLGYVKRYQVARSRLIVPFLVGGQWTKAKTDVVVIGRKYHEIGLIVQEDKRQAIASDPTAQLIAAAIAAFAANNESRRQNGSDPLDLKIIPGIVMSGTVPIFYKIPVTTDLERAVRLGMYPKDSTPVSYYTAEVARPHRRASEGMRPLDNRRVILQYFEAFRKFIET